MGAFDGDPSERLLKGGKKPHGLFAKRSLPGAFSRQKSWGGDETTACRRPAFLSAGRGSFTESAGGYLKSLYARRNKGKGKGPREEGRIENEPNREEKEHKALRNPAKKGGRPSGA